MENPAEGVIKVSAMKKSLQTIFASKALSIYMSDIVVRLRGGQVQMIERHKNIVGFGHLVEFVYGTNKIISQ